MQTGLSVSGHYITGTLHNLTSGALVDAWGEGYFMALDFIVPDSADVKVGMVPSQGDGFVELDEDHNGVFKVTDKNSQVFQVITTMDGKSKTDTYYLNRLILD